MASPPTAGTSTRCGGAGVGVAGVGAAGVVNGSLAALSVSLSVAEREENQCRRETQPPPDEEIRSPSWRQRITRIARVETC